MALSTVNPFKPVKVAGSLAIWLVPQSDTLNPESAEETADLSTVEDAEWRNIANCKSTTYTQETEDDEEDNFDAVTKTRIRKSNTTITGRTYEFELERYSLFFEALMNGVKDPLSEATATALGAGQKVQIFASNEPNVPVGVKLEMYDKSGNLQWTKYFYADVKADGEMTFDGKILRPKLTAEVTSSVWNKQENTQQFTGQTGEPDSP